MPTQTLHDEGSTSSQVRATTFAPTPKIRMMVWFPDAFTGDETSCHATPLTEAYICSGEYARKPPSTTTAPATSGPIELCVHAWPSDEAQTAEVGPGGPRMTKPAGPPAAATGSVAELDVHPVSDVQFWPSVERQTL